MPIGVLGLQNKVLEKNFLSALQEMIKLTKISWSLAYIYSA